MKTWFLKLTVVVGSFLIVTSGSLRAGEGHVHGHEHEEERSSVKKSKKKLKKKKKTSSEHKHGDDEHSHDESEEGERGHQHESKKGHGGHDETSGGHGESGEHDDHGGSGIGAGKAITAVKDEGNSFQLSKEAENFLNIKTSTVRKLGDGNLFQVSNQSLVEYQEKIGVFFKQGDWFRLVQVLVKDRGKNESSIEASTDLTGGGIVVAGLGHLRTAHLQATGQGGKGHAH